MENKIICQRCGAEASDGSSFCTKCGAKLGEKIFCQECGTEVKPGSDFCQACGAPLSKKAEETLKDSVKYTTDTVKPIIATGKERTKSRKISDLLLFFATALLLIVPFVSFIEISGGLVWNSYISIANRAVEIPTGLLWGEIRLLSSFADLVAYGTAGSALFTIFIIPYFIVLSIVSFVTLIKSIVKACKGESYNITKLSLKALARIFLFFVFASIFSTSYLSVRPSNVMMLTLIFAIILIFASAILSLVANRNEIFVSIRDGFGAISTLAFFIISTISALFLINFSAFDYVSIFIRAAQASSDDLTFILGSIIGFPTLIFGFIVLLKNLKNMKLSYKSAVYVNYASREERAYRKRSASNHFSPISHMVLVTIYFFLTCALAFVTLLSNVEAILWILSNFSDFNFIDSLSYLLRAFISPFAFYTSLSFIIWILAVLNVVAYGVCNSLAKKKIETLKSDESQNV